MPIVRPSDLPKDTAPPASDYVVIDGVGLRATTIQQLVVAGRPTASTLEAQTGTNDFNAMTPLKTKQAIDFIVSAGYVPTSRAITAGTGLTGGGTLASNREIALNSTSIASLAKADTAVQPSRAINPGVGLEGGGTLAADRTIGLNPGSIELLNKAGTAVQPEGLAPVATSGAYADLTGKPTLGALAAKDQVAIADISATGTPGPTSALFGDGSWKLIPGGGDMLKSVYDPQNKETDAFARANHTGTQAPSTISFPAWVVSLIGLNMQANQIAYGTGANTMALTAFSSFARTLVALTNGGAVYGALGEIPDGQLPPRLQTSGEAVTNLNTITMNGQYRHAPGATGQPVTGASGLVTHIQYDSTNSAIQYWIRAGVTEASALTYIRHKAVGVWGSWQRTYNKEAEINGLINSIAADYLPLSGGTITGGLTVNGTLETRSTVIQLRADGNKHLYFRNLAGTEDALIYYDNASNVLRLRVGAGPNVYINEAGGLVAAGTLFAGGGSASMSSEGSLVGSIWSDWGSSIAKNAISSRIEGRGAAYRDNAVAQAEAALPSNLAAMAVGSIGTYALLCLNAGTAAQNPGAAIASTFLAYSSADSASHGGAALIRPSGSWRLMGRTFSDSTDALRTSLCLRYA